MTFTLSFFCFNPRNRKDHYPKEEFAKCASLVVAYFLLAIGNRLHQKEAPRRGHLRAKAKLTSVTLYSTKIAYLVPCPMGVDKL